jgi:competence protein ComEC
VGVRPPVWLADAFLRSPAVAVSASMMLGIALARLALPCRPWPFLAFGVLSLLCSIVLFRRPWLSSLALLLGIACAAVAGTHLALNRFSHHDIAHYSTEVPRLCRLKLYLPNEPRIRQGSIGDRVKLPPRQTLLADVRRVFTHAGWRDATGTVLLQVQEVHPDLAAGQTIEVVAQLERPGPAMNPGQFDWQRYYRDQRILCSVRVKRADNITILTRGAAPWLTQWREGMRTMLARGFDPAQSLDQSLLAALVLGDYDPEIRDVAEQFRQTGTGHHLAISGMHIAIVGGLVFLLGRLVGLRPRACWLGGMLIVGLYGAAAMPSPPVIRSLLLFGVAGSAVLLGRLTSTIHLLSLSVALMLALHPLDLFNAGFQLSFGTVLGLLLLSEPLATRWVNEDKILMPDEIARLPTRARVMRWIDHSHVKLWSAGTIAWLVSMPLVASHFTRLNPWQVPASLLLAPLVTLSLLAGVVKIIGTAICPPLAPWLATMAAGSSRLMRGLVDWLASAPYGDVPLTAPPAWVAALCWVSLCVWATRWRAASLRIGSAALVLATFVYMLVGPYWFGTSRTLASGQLRVTVMAVGAGQCVLIEPAGGRPVLIDCGSASLTDLAGNVVRPLLREYGHTSIDRLFITHANTDHYSAAAEIADAYGVREILTAGTFAAQMRVTPSGNSAMRQFSAIDLPPRVLRPGDQIPLDKDTLLDVLWPDPRSALSANDTSLVLRLSKAGRSILFTGDVQAQGMSALLASDIGQADVLLAPHHGSSEPNSPAFIEAVAPRWIVSSNDRTLSNKQREFETMIGTRELLRTHRVGAVTILIDADGTIRVDGFLR